jgi:hypothetical protein
MSVADRTPLRLALTLFALAALIASVAPPARAHHAEKHGVSSPSAPAADAPVEAQVGTVEVVVIEDRVVDMTIRYVALKLADGTSFALKGAAVETLTSGAWIEATGQRNGNTLFVTQVRVAATPPGAPRANAQASQTLQAVGTLRLAHSDYFDTGRSDFMFHVETDDGTMVPLKFAALPDALQAGMRVIVTGKMDVDGVSVLPDSIAILALAPSRTDAISPAAVINNVLVILMQYADQPTQPFTQAAAQMVYGGGAGSGSVAEYYKEVSAGLLTLNVTVTPWMQSAVNKPATCDNTGSIYTSTGNALATAAGYALGNYQHYVYVFPSLSACGWAGLAYVGGPQSYINGYNYTSVYGHELGHNFGLLHAGSLTCANKVIGGSCSVTEYGDQFDIMGNSSTMHINAQQKDYLGWLPTSSVLTQSAGSGTYALTPVELGGGTTYAVTVPTRANRTYWMEYRQPIGFFDQAMSTVPNNGVQVRVESPFEWVAGNDDTQVLDMTPATSTFNDAALLAGKNFRDPTAGLSLSVLAATPTSLSLFVQMNTQPIVADFNGDGKADLLWTNPSTGETLMQLMNGSTIVGGGSLLISPSWAVTHVGDFNGDGKSDLIWRNSATGETAMWLMNGAALIGGGSLMTNPSWMVTHVADFNGDGKADLLWRNLTTGETVIWLMNGTSIIGSGSIMADPNWVAAYVGDFNGDGKADIVWRHVVSGQTAIWLMNGASLISGAGIMSDPNWMVTHVADFNGDGKADLVWRNTNTGSTALWLMNGTTFIAGVGLQNDASWHVTHVADLNGDGKADLIWRNLSTGQTAAWLMNGTAIISGAGLLGYGWTVVRTGDFDGNGKADIVWRNSSTDQTALWLMNGATPASGYSLTTDPNWFVQP